MRTISKLLEIIRENAEVENNEISFGLCNEVEKLCKNGLISHGELLNMKEYIFKETPVYNAIPVYGWPPCEWLPRLKWLNEHIELNKEKEQ